VTTRRGFTLIEVLVVVAIIGILVAISAANLLNAIQRARQKRTMADMRTLALGIESFTTDFNRYPAAAGYVLPSGLALPTATLSTIHPQLTPTYIKMVPLRDGWDSWFTYSTDPTRPTMRFDRTGGRQPRVGARFRVTHVFDSDVILVDGTFVQYPAGPQR